MKIEIKGSGKKFNKIAPYIVGIVKSYDIPNVTKIYVIDTDEIKNASENTKESNILVAIFTKNHINADNYQKEIGYKLSSYFGVEPVVFLSQDPESEN
jgi:hypothetical protein